MVEVSIPELDLAAIIFTGLVDFQIAVLRSLEGLALGLENLVGFDDWLIGSLNLGENNAADFP